MADGINKVVAAKKETTWGTKATASGAQLYPRVTGAFQLEKDAYQSEAIRPSQQVGDSRHGTRRATGSIEGELQCGAYEELQAAALRGTWAGTATTGALTTIAAVTAGFTRTGGDFLADGFKAGMLINVTGFTAPATANNTRYVVTSVTALALNARRLDGEAIVAKAAGDSVTIAIAGKMVYTPQTGHTDDSFTIEEWHSDISLSRITLGQQVNTMTFGVQPNAMCTNGFEFLGKDAEPAGAVRYFTSPTAVPATGTMSGPDGLALIDGIGTCKLTSLDLTIDNGITQESVIACKGIGAKSRGKVMGSGSFTAILDDDTYLNYFDAEQEVTFSYTFNGTDGTSFSLYAPRMKINSATVNDGEVVLIITCNFDILEYVGTDADKLPTTLVLQDSTL